MTASASFLARMISSLSHPLLVLTYGLVLIIAFNPYVFGTDAISGQLPLILITLAYTFLLPFISIVFMKLIGLVKSLQLDTREERIGPLIICIVFYTWFYINVYRNTEVPFVVSVFAFGSVIALSITFFLTVFTKISLHLVAWGGISALMINMFWHFGYNTLSIGRWEVHIHVVLILLLMFSSIVATARLLMNAHRPKDIYGGFLVGFTAQFIAIRFLL